MKLLILTVGFALLLFGGTAGAEEPTLVSVQCIFATTTDDKAQGTSLDIVLKNAEGNDIAKAEGIESQWDRNSVHTVMLDLTVKRPKSEVENGNITLAIRPLSEDKWEFNYTVRFEFSDKSSMTRKVTECVLTETLPKRTDAVKKMQVAEER